MTKEAIKFKTVTEIEIPIEHIDNNVVLWQTIEVPSNGYSEEWAKTAIEEMLPELEKKIIKRK